MIDSGGVDDEYGSDSDSGSLSDTESGDYGDYADSATSEDAGVAEEDRDVRSDDSGWSDGRSEGTTEGDVRDGSVVDTGSVLPGALDALYPTSADTPPAHPLRADRRAPRRAGPRVVHRALGPRSAAVGHPPR